MLTNTNQFCNWDCQSDINAVFMIIILVTAFLVTIHCCLTYAKIMMTGKIKRQLHYKFIAMMIWGIRNYLSYPVFIGSIIFSLVVYYQYFQHQIQNQINLNITKYSTWYALFSTIPAIIVQGLLTVTAKTMITNAMGVLLSQNIQPTPKQQKIYKFMNKYIYIRLILVFLTIAVFFSESSIYKQVISQIKIFAMLIDCIVSVYLLFQCHKYLKNQRMILLPNNKNEQHTLLTDTRLLIFCSIIRLIVDFIVYIAIPIYWYTDRIHRDIKCLRKYNITLIQYLYSIGYILIGTHFLHHLPIMVVVSIFKPKNQNSQLFQSRQSLVQQAQTTIFN